jgi:hypothetical protein
MFCIKSLCASYRNLVSSDTSCYEYLSFLTWPSSSSPTYTLAGMRGRETYATGFLRGELGVCTLSFYCGGWFKVPTTFGCSPMSHSGQAEAYSTVSLAGCSEMLV